jgi:hypothetical protein
MRLSICAALIAVVQQCAAAPSFRASEQGPGGDVAMADDEEALKYFHEPGYVAIFAVLLCLASK